MAKATITFEDTDAGEDGRTIKVSFEADSDEHPTKAELAAFSFYDLICDLVKECEDEKAE